MPPNRGRLRAPPGMGGERSTASVRVGGQPWQALRQRPSATDATRAAVAARRAAWFEDERGAGRRRLATDDLVVQDDDPAIEQFAHVDRQPGVGARATELHHARPEAHGVVAGDHAAVAAAEAEGGGRAPRRGGRRRGEGPARGATRPTAGPGGRGSATYANMSGVITTTKD